MRFAERGRALLLAAALVLATDSPLGAQAPAVVSRDGWEAFLGVEYQGGDARFPKKLLGVLVLTDSTLALHRCESTWCDELKDRPLWKEPAFFTIPLSAITSVEASSQVRSPGVASKIAWGFLANDRKEEFVGIVHETESSAEAPVFKVRQTQSSAIDAKIRFRLKKLGRELPEAK